MRFQNNVEIHYDAFRLVGVPRPTHLFDRYDLRGRPVTHFDHVPAGPVAQIAHQLNIVDMSIVNLTVYL